MRCYNIFRVKGKEIKIWQIHVGQMKKKLAVERFLDVASEYVVGYDMPSVYFEKKE